MHLPAPLERATLIRRYKRFLADVTMDDGRELTVHCPNPGAMTGLATPGDEIWLLPANSPKRKLPYGWELTRVGDHLVGINTVRPNTLVGEAIAAGTIAELAGYDGMRREVAYGRNSRIDLLLEADGKPPCYVEVKNVHLKRDDGPAPGAAEFPDSITARGAKHLDEMADMVAGGARAVMVYCVQRDDCDRFTLAGDVDPTYAERFRAARKAGVEAVAYACTVGLNAIEVTRPLAIDI